MNKTVVIVLCVFGGLGLLCCGGFSVLFVVLAAGADSRVDLASGGELYYSSDITEDEADGVVEYLEEGVDKETDHKVSYRLDKDDSTYRFGAVILDDKVDDPVTEILFRAICKEISDDVLGGEPVDFVMYDEYLDEVRVLKWED